MHSKILAIEHQQAMSIVESKDLVTKCDYLINFAKVNGGIDYTYTALDNTIES